MSAAEETPRRLTPTERLHEVTMAAMHRRPAEPEQSVTLARNARGIVQPEVTARGIDLDAVLAQTMAAFDVLCDRYPYPTNGTGQE